MRYLPLTSDDRSAMLATIGAASIEDLFADVPLDARLDARQRTHGRAPYGGAVAPESRCG